MKSAHMIDLAAYQELAAATILAASYPFDRIERGLHAYQPRLGDAVVLIHGFGGDRSNLLPLRAYLQLAGFPNVVYFEYPKRQSLGLSVAKLLELIQTLSEAHGTAHLVGHSLGGVIARESERRARPGAVSSLITLGSPYYPDQLSPRELAIFGEEDLLIVAPRPDSLRPDALKRAIVLPRTGHFALLYHPRAWQSLLAEIRDNRARARARRTGA
jgi:pimeloyl-ACP methyl ester carboxylesterase